MNQRLEDIFHEAETSEETECASCKIAAGIGITRNLCDEFKHELDCRELLAMLNNPDYTLEEVEQAIKKLAQAARGEPKAALDYTLCLMKGECSLESPPSLKR